MQLQKCATFGRGEVIGLVAVVVPEGMTGKGLVRQLKQERERAAKAQAKQVRDMQLNAKHIEREAKLEAKRKRAIDRANKREAKNNPTTLKNVKRGDYFKLVNYVNGVQSFTKTVYVKGEYDRAQKKYGFYKFDDVNAWRYLPGTRPITTDFEF